MPSVFELLRSVKTSIVPAWIMLGAAFCCTVFQHIDFATLNTFHGLFYLLSAVLLTFLFLKAEYRQLLFCAIILGLYVVFNHLRLSPTDGRTFFVLHTLLFLVPLNLIFLFAKKQFVQSSVFYALLFGTFQGIVVENIAAHGTPHLSYAFGLLSYALWGLMFIYLLIKASFNPSSKQTGVLFASFCLCFALFNALNSTPFVLYSFAAQLILLYTNMATLIHNYYKDETTGVYSKNAFQIHDVKKFPPKYTMSFFTIDNYTELLKVFGPNQTAVLTKMIIEKVASKQPEAFIYRSKENEFVLVFFALDVKQTYEAMEEIRRLVACTEFVFAKNKSIKLTITPVVSEKRRSDADASAVLRRMHENFHQKYNFMQNMTFCEEIETAKKSAA